MDIEKMLKNSLLVTVEWKWKKVKFGFAKKNTLSESWLEDFFNNAPEYIAKIIDKTYSKEIDNEMKNIIFVSDLFK